MVCFVHLWAEGGAFTVKYNICLISQPAILRHLVLRAGLIPLSSALFVPTPEQVVSECHMSWRNLLGQAELGDVKSNLSVSKMSDLASDIEPENVVNGFDREEDEEDAEYPTSLVA